MGTNYYFKPNKSRYGFENMELVHIGKSSGGWCFSLHAHPNLGINDLKDWEDVFNLNIGEIENEYNDPITSSEMIAIITARSWKYPRKLDAKFYQQNHAVPGPNGLVRSIIDENHCIGWGNNNDINSTWDLFISDFS